MSEPAPKPLLKYSIALGTVDDVAELCQPGGLAEQFFNESMYSEFLTWDPEEAKRRFSGGVADCVTALILAKHYDETVGFCLYDAHSAFSKEKVAHMVFCWVAPEHRRTPLGRMLASAAVGLARDEGMKAFFFGVMSGVDERTQKRAMNMLKKLGFTPTGGLAYQIL